MGDTEKFWMDDPSALFSNTTVIPNANMTNAERLNALTRLLLVITTGMYFLGYEQYFTVLVLGILLIIVLRGNLPKEGFTPEITEGQALRSAVRGFDPTYDSRPHVGPNQPCWSDQGVTLLNAAYEVTPPIQFNHYDDSKRSYMNAKYELTPLTDTDGFKEIWRNEPGMCGGYSMVPDPQTMFPVDDPEARGECNYIVRSKVDHLPVNLAANDLTSIRPMAERDFEQSVLDFRSAIMNEHIDRFRRERQHNCPDMKLNAFSAGSGGNC